MTPQEKRRRVARLRMKLGEDRRQLNSLARNAHRDGMSPTRITAIDNVKASIARNEHEIEMLRYF